MKIFQPNVERFSRYKTSEKNFNFEKIEIFLNKRGAASRLILERMKMAFKYQPIQLSEPRKIELPKHLHSGNPLKNRWWNFISLSLEGILLGRNPNFEIFERTYETPVKT